MRDFPAARNPHASYPWEPLAVRVAIDVTPLLGVRTGMGQYVAELVDALGRLPEQPALLPYALSLRARRHRDALPTGTCFPPVPARIALAAWPRLDHPRLDLWLGRPDVLHATNYLAPPSRHPVVVTVADCTFVRHPELVSHAARAVAPILRRALRRGAWVHAISNVVADDVRECFAADLVDPGRVVAVSLGVPHLGDGAAPGAAVRAAIAAGPFVLALGTIEPRKNLPRLVGAFALLTSTDVRLVIAGPDGPDRPSLDAAIASLPTQVAARVTVLGPVTDDGRAALLRAATVLAYPSLLEGFGLPVLEAMTVGTPVVAGRAGSIPEIAGDAAELVDPLDEAAIAAGLTRVLDDQAYCDDLVDKGRERAAHYTWDATARGLAALYHRAAGDVA